MRGERNGFDDEAPAETDKMLENGAQISQSSVSIEVASDSNNSSARDGVTAEAKPEVTPAPAAPAPSGGMESTMKVSDVLRLSPVGGVSVAITVQTMPAPLRRAARQHFEARAAPAGCEAVTAPAPAIECRARAADSLPPFAAGLAHHLLLDIHVLLCDSVQ